MKSLSFFLSLTILMTGSLVSGAGGGQGIAPARVNVDLNWSNQQIQLSSCRRILAQIFNDGDPVLRQYGNTLNRYVNLMLANRAYLFSEDHSDPFITTGAKWTVKPVGILKPYPVLFNAERKIAVEFHGNEPLTTLHLFYYGSFYKSGSLRVIFPIQKDDLPFLFSPDSPVALEDIEVIQSYVDWAEIELAKGVAHSLQNQLNDSKRLIRAQSVRLLEVDTLNDSGEAPNVIAIKYNPVVSNTGIPLDQFQGRIAIHPHRVEFVLCNELQICRQKTYATMQDFLFRARKLRYPRQLGTDRDIDDLYMGDLKPQTLWDRLEFYSTQSVQSEMPDYMRF